jgi:hypothetical protein
MTQNTTHVLLILLGGFVGGLAGSALMGGSPDTDDFCRRRPSWDGRSFC